MTTPQSRLVLAGLIIVFITAIASYLALQAPMLDIDFAADKEGGVVINNVKKHSLNEKVLYSGQTITSLNSIPLDADLLIEEPDQLGSWQKYNSFHERLTQIFYSSPAALEAQLDGKTVVLTSRQRDISDLPLMFWFQIAVGAIAFLIAAGVYAFRHQDSGALHFVLAGLSLFISSSSAAIYSTRELIINGGTVHLFSIVNQSGAIFFTAALVALLWEYPKRIHTNRVIVPAIYLTALLCWACFALQIYPDTSTVYISTLALFSLSFLFAFIQWQNNADSPVARASLKWYLLSIYLGTGLFATLILLPVALGIEPPASQGLMFMVFLFMFIGIAFGITRYRLFDLDRWWFAAWMWFFGGLLVIAIDACLLWLLDINTDTSLALSLALIGWLYFPARQWLFAHFRDQKTDRNRQINELVNSLFRAETPAHLAELWQQFLANEFSVLDLQIANTSISEPYINNDAQYLLVPHLVENQHLILMHPTRGSRLFNHDDKQTVSLLYAIAKQALEALQTRLQAHEEKLRIFSDLHDDVGAKLLSLFYRSTDPNSSELARSALQDLRDVVSQPDSGVLALTAALADWRDETQQRLDDADLALHWQQSQMTDDEVSVHTLRHIARILREAINNILKHAEASKVEINIENKANILLISISDDGHATDPNSWLEGRGISNIKHRINQLNGHCEWRKNTIRGCTLDFKISLK
jgi:signal transduction histidine kinase